MRKGKRKGIGRRIPVCVLAVALVGLLQAIPGTVLTAYAANNITVTIDTGASVTLKDTDNDGYYEIGNADELYAFAAAVNGGNTGINGELTGDIVVNDSLSGSPRAWTPIGSYSQPYVGTFDGGGHTVKGLYYNNKEVKYIGLFGGISRGWLKNVGVIDSSFSGKESVGSVCGYNYYGTVTNCYNKGSVSGSKYIGGVCGTNYSGTMTNCYNEGSVSGSEYIGGVCGHNNGGTMTNCYNEGSVSGVDSIGGVCGVNGTYSKVKNCYNKGSVSGESSAGGVCGSNATGRNGIVTDCVYLSDRETDGLAGTTYVTEADFQSGKACLLLKNGAWGQNIGRDKKPVWDGAAVYQHTLNSTTFYSNGAEAATYNNGVYEIDSADELRWFVDAVNCIGLTGNVKLTADIDMTGRVWNCMDKYAGIFDGAGHTITGLCNNAGMADGNKFGLIQTLVSGGTVTNLIISKADLWSNDSAGAIAAVNNGVISKCIVKDSTIQLGASDGLAAIAGRNAGTVTNCGVANCSFQRRWGAVNNNSFAIGAIVEDNTGTVSNCFSYGCTFSKSPNMYAIVESGNVPVDCYYYTTAGVSDTAATVKTAAQFASGEVAYLLNGSTIKGNLVWGQALGTDKYPVFKTDNNLVCKNPTEEVYSNHNQFNAAGFCATCGGYEKPEIIDGVYRIENAGQLCWFAEFVNKGNQSANAKLTADIDMKNIAWTTICETGLYYSEYGSDMGYSGIFDGNGHVISNLTVASSEDKDASVGLFGTVSGTIKNLGMKNFTLVDKGKDMRAGAIVGQLITANGKVSDCYVIGATIKTNNRVAGGIAGCVYEGTVENCYVAAATIKAYRFGYVAGDVCADGSDGDGTDRPGVVKNCFTDGGVITGTQKGAESVVGGEAEVSADRFASGEIAYLLNDSTSTGNLTWYQKLDESADAYPVLNSAHGTVYSVFMCDGITPAGYSNVNENKLHTEKNSAGYCKTCGTVFDGISAFAGHSVDIRENIDLKFYMELDASVLADDTAYMQFTMEGKDPVQVMVKDVKGSPVEQKGKTCYVFSYKVASKEMSDTIEAQLFCSDGNGGTREGIAYEYSVKQYAEALIDDNTVTDDQKNVARAMLDYGAYVQNYFEHNTGALANATHSNGALTITAEKMDVLLDYKPIISDENDGIDYAGTTLILEEKIKMRHYFKLEDGAAAPAGLTKYDEIYYYYESDGITIVGLGNEMTYTGVTGISVKYCPLSYVTTVLRNTNTDLTGNTDLQNLMKALYLYYQAAQAYNS